MSALNVADIGQLHHISDANLSRTQQYLQFYIDTMKSQVGVKENKVNGEYNNHGTMVDEYQRVAGYPNGGLSWCCCFQYWCNYKTATHFGMSTVPMIKTGSCQQVQDWARANKIIVDPYDGGSVPFWPQIAKRPMLCLVTAGGTKRVGNKQVVVFNPHAHHITGIRDWSSGPMANGANFYNIEGNTNMDGSAEGYEVADRMRAVSGSYRFVDFAQIVALEFEKMYPTAPADALWDLVSSANPTKPLMKLIVENGTSWANIREFCAMFNIPVEWVPVYQNVKMGGKIFTGELTMHDDASGKPNAYGKVRDLVSFIGLKIVAATTAKTVMVART